MSLSHFADKNTNSVQQTERKNNGKSYDPCQLGHQTLSLI
jgi:hypothetical protein